MWTVREDKLLEEAVDFCRQHGVEFYAVNTNYPEEQEAHQHFSRKLKADVFIDDRNLGECSTGEAFTASYITA